MDGRIPLTVEASIESLAGTVSAHEWAWTGDSALAAHGLLRWRGHDHTLALLAPSDQFDPEALAWAMERLVHARASVSHLRSLAVVQVPVGPTRLTATLQGFPMPARSSAWEADTVAARILPGGSAQRTVCRDHTLDTVLRRWIGTDHNLPVTIDAVTVAATMPHARFRDRCAQLSPHALAQAGERLTLLHATPDVHLCLHVRPRDHAALRAAAADLQRRIHSRELSR